MVGECEKWYGRRRKGWQGQFSSRHVFTVVTLADAKAHDLVLSSWAKGCYGRNECGCGGVFRFVLWAWSLRSRP